MNSSKYWQDRFELLEIKIAQDDKQYIEELLRAYNKAISKIERDIELWYYRIAINNETSLAMAKKILTAKQLTEFKWTLDEYIKYGKANSLNGRWIKQLENASARVHIERLQAMQTQIRQQLEILAAKQVDVLTRGAANAYSESYHRTIYEVQKGLGMGAAFQKIDVGIVEKTISKPWSVDGKTFSARLWEKQEKLVNVLQEELTRAFILGESIEKTTRRIVGILGEEKTIKRNVVRLVQTERAAFASKARLDGFEETGVEMFQFSATLDHKTSAICADMDGKIFKLADAKIGVNVNPLHPSCRSTTVPYFGGNVTERIARNAEGKTYIVPEDISYREWLKKYA